ncbi:hypothetical protein TRFO_41403 [Tritrichomonas foetus]|uniref:Uncharacterized protein n=1 Tax=Tritrichomonas foetus TaxID=1144522 RepID=A0A1J4L0P0_9EUKA|nr:hypothetical protein TRFO_41403 [Tritrichomonas foetus]|eukprot:OHT16978.1 hypothetical protein TRFO_41403 [Tritrichomonas foetus]
MLLITDVEKLTGYWICPKCNSHCIFKDSHFKRNKEAHEKTCMGDKVSLVTLENEANPYIPQFTKNKLYTYTFAHKLHYGPIRYYITYDFETRRLNNEILEPICVALTALLKDKDITISYYGNNFINVFINDLLKYGDIVRNDNIRNFKENIPSNEWNGELEKLVNNHF